MESQPQIPEFRINPENFHPCNVHIKLSQNNKLEIEPLLVDVNIKHVYLCEFEF